MPISKRRFGYQTEFNNSWTNDAISFLNIACQRHGGWEAWRLADEFLVRTSEFTGGLARLKGFGKTFELPPCIVCPSTVSVRFLDFPKKGCDLLYSAGVMTIVDALTRRVMQHIPNHRRTFSGIRKFRKWNNIDIAYFMGNGLPIYLGVPFLLTGASLKKYSLKRRGMTTYHRFDIRWPAWFETHSSDQAFEFHQDGLFSRMEYTAEIVGKFPPAVHTVLHWSAVAGLVVGDQRLVSPRVFGYPFGPTLAKLKLDLRPLEYNAS